MAEGLDRHMARGGDEIVAAGDVGRDLAQDRLKEEKMLFGANSCHLGG